MDKRTELMRQIRDEVVDLKNSPLYQYRIENNNLPVIGEGSHHAKIIFIGEAPGKNEAATGRPFCGRAGDILDELLASVNIRREDVYITNILKDRPPDNRDPLPDEIAVYAPFLNQQIEIIQPPVIVTLGRFAMRYVLAKFGLPEALEPISRVQGQVFESEAPYGPVKLVPLYHPAVATYSPSQKDNLKRDFKILEDILEK